MNDFWQRANETGILPAAVDETLTDQWNRFRVDPVAYLDARHFLEYSEPQANWFNGCPMGNGDLGVLAYGPPEASLFSFGKTDLWDYRPFGASALPPVPYSELRAALAAGDSDFFMRVQRQWSAGAAYPQITAKPGGMLRLELFPSAFTSHFRQRLSLAHGQTVQSWTPVGDRRTKDRSYEDSVVMTSFVHAAQNVFVVRIAPQATFRWHENVNFTFGRYEDPDMELPQAQAKGNRFWVRQTLPGGEHFIMMGAVDSAGLTINEVFNRIQGHGIPQAKELTFYVTIVTSRDTSDPLAQAHRNIDEALKAGYEKLHESHENWWHDFWRRGYVCTPWKTVERAWYYALYLQASTCRPGRTSPGLQGNWIKENYPAWNGDFHNNINMQILYWGQYTANRLELAEPFYRLFWDILPRCKKDTAEYFKMRGARYPISMGPDGCETAPGLLLSTWIGGGGWLAQHFWWHYQYSQDREFLNRYAYPLLKECALFYEDYLQTDEQGRLYVFPTIQMEINVGKADGAGRNSAWDLPVVIRTFQMALAAARALDTDQSQQKIWEGIIQRLPSIPANDEDVWMEFEDKGGLWHIWDWARFMPIFPMELVGADSGPAVLRRQAKSTIDEYYRFRADPDKVPGFAGTIQAASLLRMGEVERGLKMAEHVCNTLNPSGFITNHDAYFLQVDAPPGLSIFLNEMLLQSYDGLIRVFPVVPSGKERVCFHSLRAQGGFLVSAERRDNRVQYVVVKSLAGNQLRMVNPFVGEPDRGVQVKVYVLDQNTRLNTVNDQMKADFFLDRIYLPGQIIEFPTAPGQTYLISKELPWYSCIPVEDIS